VILNFVISLGEGSIEWNFDVTGDAALGRNFDVKIGRAALETCSATWNLCANSQHLL
jgi:hypothetical protein